MMGFLSQPVPMMALEYVLLIHIPLMAWVMKRYVDRKVKQLRADAYAAVKELHDAAGVSQ